MKTWAKIAIGCLVVLCVLCIAAAATLFFAGSWVKSKVGGFFGGAVATGQNVAAIQQMEQRFPFSEPADGLLDEARLQAFLGASGKVRAVVDQHEPALRALLAGEGKGMDDASKALEAMGALSGALKQGLEGAQMSPSEFRWIAYTAFSALEEGPADGGSQIEGMEGFEAMTRAGLEVLEPQLENPDLTAEQREALEGQIAELKAQLGQGPAADPGSGGGNAALAERYRAELERVDVREFMDLGLSGQMPH